jgi:hypothetical protein
MRSWLLRLAGLASVLVLATGPARADNIHLYAYDPADSVTRQAAGPLTFTFKKGLLHNTLLNVMSTEAEATAVVRRVDDNALGHGGLAKMAGITTQERDLYEVESIEEGPAMISAFCPGSARAWMAIGPLRLNRDLTVLVIGQPEKGGGARLCKTLQFSFHGEWLGPPERAIDPRSLEPRRFPGA